MKSSELSLRSSLLAQMTPETSVAVALSGGADSVCLLHLFSLLAKKKGLRLSAVHVHHHLRGKEADADADFCRDLCLEMGIPLTVLDVFVAEQKQQGESLEAAARRLRYAAFETVEADWIATAHNADDALETFLINFARGSGLRGLCGIPEQRGRYIRPLLHAAKQDILDYCTAQGLHYVTDGSNASDDFVRNRLRHHVLPELTTIFPAIRTVGRRNFEWLRTDLSFLEQEADRLYQTIQTEQGLLVKPLATAHEALATRVLSNYCVAVTNRVPDALHCKQMLTLCQKGQGSVGLFSGYFAEVLQGIFVIRAFQKTAFSVETEQISAEKVKYCRNVHNLFFKNAIDYDKMIGMLVLRTRAPADTMRPFGRGMTKAVRRLQAEAGIPKELRDTAPIAADENGPVWGYEIGVDERVAVDENTKNLLIFKVYQTENRGQ